MEIISYISLIFSAILFLFVIVSSFSGMRKSFSKNFSLFLGLLITLVATTILAVVIADLSKDYIQDLLKETEYYQKIVDISAGSEILITAIIKMVCIVVIYPILFFVLLVIIKAIINLIHNSSASQVNNNKYGKSEKPKKTLFSRLTGLLFGAVTGFVYFSVLFMPIITCIDFVSAIGDTVVETVNYETEESEFSLNSNDENDFENSNKSLKDDQYIKLYIQYVKPISKGEIFEFYNKINLQGIYLDYACQTTIENDGTVYNLNCYSESKSFLKFAGSYYVIYSSINNGIPLNSKQVEIFADNSVLICKNQGLCSILNEALVSLGTKYAEDGTFLGQTIDSNSDNISDKLIGDILISLKDSTTQDTTELFKSLSDIACVVSKNSDKLNNTCEEKRIFYRKLLMFVKLTIIQNN